MNLWARHFYALTLYAVGHHETAREQLLEVTQQAREKGELQEEGLLIPGAAVYFGPKRRLVAGFSIPEAAADLALLEALGNLEQYPENALLWQNVGHSLLELPAARLAVDALNTAWKHYKSLIETRFLRGVALRKLGRNDDARADLLAVIRANPQHPRARWSWRKCTPMPATRRPPRPNCWPTAGSILTSARRCRIEPPPAFSPAARAAGAYPGAESRAPETRGSPASSCRSNSGATGLTTW